MRDASTFRQNLALRLIGALGVAALAAPPSACSSSGGAQAASTTGSSSSSSSSSSGTMMMPPHDGGAGGAGAGGAATGGAPATGGAAATGGAGGAGGAANPPVQACFDWPLVLDGGMSLSPPDAGPAPNGCPMDFKQVLYDFQEVPCTGWEPYDIVSGPTTNTEGQCCYMVYQILCGPGGRPFLVDDEAKVAPLVRGARGWSAVAPDGALALSDAERAVLAAAWAKDGAMEHASVASFSRFSLALLAMGAPSELVERAHRAALDEVHHARLCFALASRYAGEPIAPGPFPIAGDARVDADLVSLAVSTAREGCVGETLAAVVAAEQLARATDPAVREALARIAEDEAAHAELAWRTVAWAIEAGGEPVERAVEGALAAALAAGPARAPEAARGSAALAAHGHLDGATRAGAVAAALAGVVAPAAKALLSARSAARPPLVA